MWSVKPLYWPIRPTFKLLNSTICVKDLSIKSKMRWLRFHTSWTFILGWLFHAVNGDLIIIRKVNKKDNYHKDRFNIRRSKCIDIRQGNKCGFYGGFERSPNNPCKCHCPPRRGTIIKRNKQWRCTGNEVFRQREGKSSLLPNYT